MIRKKITTQKSLSNSFYINFRGQNYFSLTFQLQKRLYNCKCPSVHQKAKPLNTLILSFFIHPSFISNLDENYENDIYNELGSKKLQKFYIWWLYYVSMASGETNVSLFTNKPRMAQSCNFSKMARLAVWHYGLILQWYITGDR